MVDFRNVFQSMVESGLDIADVTSPTILFNDNDACVRWSYDMTSKAARHIELRENSVCEWCQSKLLLVKHVSGKLNPSDIFTKEIRDGMHFRRLRDSFMSRLSVLSMLTCWLSIMFVSRHFLPSLLLFMLSSRQDLFHTFQLLLLLLFADLFQLYLTSPVLVHNSFGVFLDLFHQVSHSIGFYWRFVLGSLIFCRFWFHFPTLFGNPFGLAWCLFLDARMGGVQSVRDPRVAYAKAQFLTTKIHIPTLSVQYPTFIGD